MRGFGPFATDAWTGLGSQVLVDAATVAWDVAIGGFAQVTLAGNRTMGTPTNLRAGNRYVLLVRQDAIGSRTLAFPAVYVFARNGNNVPSRPLSTAASAIDLFSFVFDGVSLHELADSIYGWDIAALATAGNARGVGSMDLQASRTAATQVASGGGSAILGGQQNTASGGNSVALGGSNNQSTSTATMAFGENASASSGISQVLGGGNNVTSGSRAVTVGGEANTASGVRSLAAGDTCTASGDRAQAFGSASNATTDYAFASGLGALGGLFGEMARASGVFTVAGDAQLSLATFRRITSGAVSNEGFLDGEVATRRYTLPDDSSFAFLALTIARRTDVDNTTNWYLDVGGLDRNAGVTALVGAVTRLASVEDVAAGDVAWTASDPNDALTPTYTGDIGMTIRWVSVVFLARVVG